MTNWRNSLHAYGTVSLFLHWLTALLILLMFVLGWGRDFAPGLLRSGMLDWHKSLGSCILGLVLIRLLWRAYMPPPPLPETMPAFTKMSAHAGHFLLYAMLLLMPLSGWFMVSAMGRDVVLFGMVKLPPLLQKTPAWVPLLKEIHGFAAYGLAALIAGHTAAALAHQLVFKDDIAQRMLPHLRRK